MRESKVCDVCGKEFVPRRSDQRCCSSYCSNKKYRAINKINTKLKKKSIEDISREADKMGLSYGKYVAYKEGRLKLEK